MSSTGIRTYRSPEWAGEGVRTAIPPKTTKPLKPKRTFEDSIEDAIDPTKDRAPQLKKQCFIEAARYWSNLLTYDTTIMPCELFAEVVCVVNDESRTFSYDLTENLEEIIRLGIEARKKVVEKEVGEFELGFVVIPPLEDVKDPEYEKEEGQAFNKIDE